MGKAYHELRDAIHTFISFDSNEREVINAWPLQRLRHIHQLAMTCHIYPGATHRRFEHSLGVMELAGRVFDLIVRKSEEDPDVRDVFPVLKNNTQVDYWKMVLRLAALCHDIGHLPFSHAAEKELLPSGWSHERLTAEILRNSEVTTLLGKMRPTIVVDDVVKLALGPEKGPQAGVTLDGWESFLSEIVVGDAFGVDRIDYLLRDSHHVGVAYGRFDHYRLLDTLRMLMPPEPEESAQPELFEQTPDTVDYPMLGIEMGGLQGSEALLIARYMMYSQVYFHPVRRILDLHLKEFLSEWLEGGRFSTSSSIHLELTDNEVFAAMRAAAKDSGAPGHKHARRIMFREHFRVVYERNPGDIGRNPLALDILYAALVDRYGPDNVRKDEYVAKGSSTPDFPVRLRDGTVAWSASYIAELPSLSPLGYIFLSPGKADDARQWLDNKKNKLLS